MPLLPPILAVITPFLAGAQLSILKEVEQVNWLGLPSLSVVKNQQVTVEFLTVPAWTVKFPVDVTYLPFLIEFNRIFPFATPGTDTSTVGGFPVDVLHKNSTVTVTWVPTVATTTLLGNVKP